MGTPQHCPTLGRCGTEAPPQEASPLITVMRVFIPLEDTTSQCAQLMACGPLSMSPAKVPLSPPTCPSSCSLNHPEDFLFFPAVASCGKPPPLPFAVPLWGGNSTVGSYVVYRCTWGFRSVANTSVCIARGIWDLSSVLCEGVVPQFDLRIATDFHLSSVSCITISVSLIVEINCGEPLAIANAIMLWDGTALAGSQVSYQCRKGFGSQSRRTLSICRGDGRWDVVDLRCEGAIGQYYC